MNKLEAVPSNQILNLPTRPSSFVVVSLEFPPFCLLFSANAGEQPSSHRYLTLGSDSLTTSNGKLSVADDPLAENSSWTVKSSKPNPNPISR
ncbi:hypothetical protein EPI10_017002 [Gossypium australe]|uniref:Uncharacterized protein n=1 Tax=Gossypium australe TaxID=47621 RepID=A0A5B6VQK9_9ROSI|nr:hypothetical protein EPI10_017002 [Gossypium australe]